MPKEQEGVYYDQCKLKETKNGFVLGCKRSQPALKIESGESEED